MEIKIINRRGNDIKNYLSNYNFENIVLSELEKFGYNDIIEVDYNGLAIFFKFRLNQKTKTIIISICKNLNNNYVWFVDHLNQYYQLLNELNKITLNI